MILFMVSWKVFLLSWYKKFCGLWFRLAINISLVPKAPKVEMGPLIRVIHVGTRTIVRYLRKLTAMNPLICVHYVLHYFLKLCKYRFYAQAFYESVLSKQLRLSLGIQLRVLEMAKHLQMHFYFNFRIRSCIETLSVRYHPNQDLQNTTVSNYTKVSVAAFVKESISYIFFFSVCLLSGDMKLNLKMWQESWKWPYDSGLKICFFQWFFSWRQAERRKRKLLQQRWRVMKGVGGLYLFSHIVAPN